MGREKVEQIVREEEARARAHRDLRGTAFGLDRRKSQTLQWVRQANGPGCKLCEYTELDTGAES